VLAVPHRPLLVTQTQTFTSDIKFSDYAARHRLKPLSSRYNFVPAATCSRVTAFLGPLILAGYIMLIPPVSVAP